MPRHTSKLIEIDEDADFTMALAALWRQCPVCRSRSVIIYIGPNPDSPIEYRLDLYECMRCGAAAPSESFSEEK
jgi:DNA-directed RNA polymerase subunit RPC12/RpoP